MLANTGVTLYKKQSTSTEMTAASAEVTILKFQSNTYNCQCKNCNQK